MKIFSIFISFYILNLPFGYLRAATKKFGLKWFLYLHIPIVIEIITRFYFNLSYYYILLFMFTLLVGQRTGAYIRKLKEFREE